MNPHRKKPVSLVIHFWVAFFVLAITFVFYFSAVGRKPLLIPGKLLSGMMTILLLSCGGAALWTTVWMTFLYYSRRHHIQYEQTMVQAVLHNLDEQAGRVPPSAWSGVITTPNGPQFVVIPQAAENASEVPEGKLDPSETTGKRE